MTHQFGNHLFLGVGGTTLSEDDKRLLSTVRPIGIILFARNFRRDLPYQEWLGALGQLIDDVKALTERSHLFVSIDHEGSQWVRTPEPITRFPAAALYRERAFEVGAATGVELRSLGINVSWAPVCDVHSNPHNPIIGPRAFGVAAEEAGKWARQYLQGLHSSGVLGCAKHFPGHGDTSTDSHKELPVVHVTKEQARSREFAAFLPCFEEQVPFVMTAHVLFPAIEPILPATLSPIILKNILREELGFKGVVVSDDLEMKAVYDLFRKPETLSQAFNAGCDMFIISRFSEPGIDFTLFMQQSFEQSLARGEVSEARAEEAELLVGKALSKAVPSETRLLTAGEFAKNAGLCIDIALGARKE